MNEIWRDIKGYEGLYQVSNLGRVKSLSRKYKHNMFGKKIIYKTSKERLLTININQGYAHVVLCKNGKCKQKLLHRLIAQSFIPNPENKPNINHIDGNGLNNNLDNLEWCTQKENIKHASDILNIFNNYQRYRDTRTKFVIQLNNETKEFMAIFNSAKETSILLDVPISTIRSSCRNSISKTAKYEYRYADVLYVKKGELK